MLFKSGAVRKRLENPIEESVGANSAMRLINFFVETIGHSEHPANSAASLRRIATLANSSTMTSQEPVSLVRLFKNAPGHPAPGP